MSKEYQLEIVQEVNQLEVLQTVVEIIEVGIQGPPGRDGQNGTGAAFEFNQPTPSSEWIINHNLGFQPPLIAVSDLAGYIVDCGIQHVSANQTRLTFQPPMAGKARLL
jgi:hypothetical protein